MHASVPPQMTHHLRRGGEYKLSAAPRFPQVWGPRVTTLLTLRGISPRDGDDICRRRGGRSCSYTREVKRRDLEKEKYGQIGGPVRGRERSKCTPRSEHPSIRVSARTKKQGSGKRPEEKKQFVIIAVVTSGIVYQGITHRNMRVTSLASSSTHVPTFSTHSIWSCPQCPSKPSLFPPTLLPSFPPFLLSVQPSCLPATTGAQPCSHAQSLPPRLFWASLCLLRFALLVYTLTLRWRAIFLKGQSSV